VLPNFFRVADTNIFLQNLEKSEKEASLPAPENVVQEECLTEVTEQVPLPIAIPDSNAASK